MFNNMETTRSNFDLPTSLDIYLHQKLQKIIC